MSLVWFVVEVGSVQQFEASKLVKSMIVVVATTWLFGVVYTCFMIINIDVTELVIDVIKTQMFGQPLQKVSPRKQRIFLPFTDI